MTEPRGRFVVENDIEWYRIDDVDLLDPFLVTVVTPYDHWIYVSTSGALTAGRGQADSALFPYETDDRLHRSGGRTGPLTLLRPVGQREVWEPFAPHVAPRAVKRALAKTAVGDRLRFEEHHPDFGLTFSYTWSSAGSFGIVRSCELVLDRDRPPVEIDVLDGLVDVLPAGVELAVQQTSSTLVDAYRRSELDPTSGLALFTLEALISDRADPAESLLANAVWSSGLDDSTVSLSDRQVRQFRSGRPIEPEHLVTGSKGAFLRSTRATIHSASPLRWIVVGDVGLDHPDIAVLRHRLIDGPDAATEVRAEIERANAALISIVAAADGLQETADRSSSVHHFANVMFNCMRGGSLLDDHRVEVADIDRFVAARNRRAHARLPALTDGLAPVVELDVVRRAVADDADLSRLANEYLPLTFSRRHGDPSRPWNTFRIPSPAADGRPARGYEGNWRDIFQNWEALVHSFPAYISSVIAKFLNASTMDGHNPYRITDDGLDWELPDDGSWANFGYWGDHQIVYLHRLLDAAARFNPGLLESMLDRCAFAYADVPYRILPFDSLVRDPKGTIEFDSERQRRVDDRVRALGTDGRLVPSLAEDGVHLVPLAEKLLVPALAKISNLVPGGGIWLNTQRPEWNDANNALVGNGVSVVTLLHLREYLQFLDNLLERSPVGEVEVAVPILEWLDRLRAAFEAHGDLVDSDRITPIRRRQLFDELGRAFSDFRSTVYSRGPGERSTLAVAHVRQFLSVVLPHLDAAAAAARRDDGLFHTYWLLRLDPDEAHLESLYPMLEGQVAVLGSSSTDPTTTLDVVDTLIDSELFRPDQQTFVLYPNRPPPPFVEKNHVPEELVGPTITALIDHGSPIVDRDVDGVVRFGSHLRSARDVLVALDELEAQAPARLLAVLDRSEVLEAYEEVFHHRAFTGRSQTMYRYEGLGSVYWHMVSKLVLAVQESVFAAADQGEKEPVLAALAERYRRLRDGLGYRKSVLAQGSFPTDPHSHTPAHTGAQQPGMTGQVKEGVLLRWGELGVRVEDGRVGFRPLLLDPAEFLIEAQQWPPLGPDELLSPGELGFTYCGVPVVYHLTDGDPSITVTRADGSPDPETIAGHLLDRATSRDLFSRTGRILRIDVAVSRADTLHAEQGAKVIAASRPPAHNAPSTS